MSDEDFREQHLRSADFLGAFGVLRRGERTLFVENEREIGGVRQRVWDLPGGQVEPGERLGEALARELDEELSIEVRGTPRLLFVQEGERVIDGERQYAWRSFFFAVEEYEGEPEASGEVHGIRWMDDAEFRRQAHAPYHDSYLEWLERGGAWFESAWRD